MGVFVAQDWSFREAGKFLRLGRPLKGPTMKRLVIIASACVFLLAVVFAPVARPAVAQSPSPASSGTPPPAAGIIPLGVTVIEMRAIVVGWSAKKDLLGHTVQNDKKENLGKIDDTCP